jgi:hypothetical protein
MHIGASESLLAGSLKSWKTGGKALPGTAMGLSVTRFGRGSDGTGGGKGKSLKKHAAAHKCLLQGLGR